jgi:hypothetical protein
MAGTDYLGNVRFEVSGIEKELHQLSAQEQLELCVRVLESMAGRLSKT